MSNAVGPNPSSRARSASSPERTLTFTEQARRAQLIAVTVELIGNYGYAGCSLQRIADAAGITKAAVIYHFTSRSSVLRAAYEYVIGEVTEHVGAAVAKARTPAEAVDAYLSSLIGHLGAHPSYVRTIIEALDKNNELGIPDEPGSPSRWGPLANLFEEAQPSLGFPGVSSKELAILFGGAADALVAERVRDPGFDLDAGAGALLRVLHGGLPARDSP